ncbi:MCE family protein [Amycolatopsis suaedae]|uniref:MCE family protein n=1 Tax=Amycolatopsis suaedae TaxID=2510978 RepID=A0A4V2EMP4_9PSEU|nr:MCE family protein [Amycolatopsis suaedae]RZQ65815.1 MCE family protein [Amycolatopsis suaedae]
MKRFSERNPVRVGVVGGVLMLAAGLLTFYAGELPGVGGTTYTAQFREAAGLKAGDEVRVAGVKVGEVDDVELTGRHVTVTFESQVWLGDRTSAAIKIKTLLGQKNLVLDPLGTGELTDAIPLDRTMTPYDVNDAFGELATTVGKLDTNQLAESFRVLSGTFSAASPEDVRATLRGLAELSTVISSRDAELKSLLGNLGTVSRTVAERTGEFQRLITDGGVLLDELNRRRQAIASLLTGTQELSRQISGLVADNRAQLGPALEQLDRVTEVLRRNQSELDRSLRLAGPFYRLLGNVVRTGPWLDTYLCGLVPAPGGGCVPPKPGGR